MRASFLLALMLSACTGLKDKPTPTDTDTGLSGPQLVVSVESIDFGAVSLGDLQSANINVSNPGTEALILSSIAVEAPFQVSPAYLELAPGQSPTITIYAQPTEYGAFTKDLTIVTDSDDLGTVTVPLSITTIADVDGDGYDTLEAGGTDCDDSDPAVHPDAEDEWYDGDDTNCDGSNDYDRDGDGYDAETDDHEVPAGMADCNDASVDFHPGAPDEPYDNRDTNCDDANDWDYDGDGYESLVYGRGSDCDDYDDTVNREGVEAFNGKDDDCNGETDDEAAAEYADYVYENSGGNFDRTGYAVAIGDLDADGIAEVIVGSPYVDATTGSGNGRGGLAVFTGPDLLGTGTRVDRADHYFEGDGTSDLLGNYVTVMGDHDGDGVNDLAIGAMGTSSNTGTVYILGGEDAVRSGRDTSDALVTYTGSTSSYFGRGIGTEIDLNADGFDEAVVMYLQGSINYVGVNYGSASPTSESVSTWDVKLSTDAAEVAFYRNAPVGGDFDGDGYEDLVLSDGKADYGSYSDNGVMWVLWGQATAYNVATPADIESYATPLVRGTSSSAYDAWATQLGDDWDGDGDNELWIYNSGQGLYVVEGGLNRRAPFDPATEAAVYYRWDDNSSDAEMIRRAGDWDGDGVSDMMVFFEDESGSYGLSELFPSSNRTGSFLEAEDNIGSLVGTNNTDTEEENGNVGYGMAPMGGDVDGDGDADFAVGDPDWESYKGQAYVLLNQGTAGE